MENKIHTKEEQALDLLENEECISNDILQQLDNDADMLETLRDAQMMRSVVAEENICVDIEKKLADFHNRHGHARKHRKTIPPYYIYASAVAVAAVILCIFFMHSPEVSIEEDSVVVFESKKLPAESVTLKTQNGKNIQINKRRTAEDKIIADYNANNDADNSEVEMMVLAVPNGESFDITLPDGTIAYVHPGSQLTFPSSFKGEKRTVELSGEAYFKVAKDPRHPFVVKSGTTETMVLGTEFDVTAYEDKPVNITLITGSVCISTETAKQILVPGEQASISPNASISTKSVDVSRYTMWRDGFLYYDNMTIENIMRSIGQIYNYSVVFYNKEHLNLKMRFITERDKGIENILKTLNSIERVNATISNGVIMIK